MSTKTSKGRSVVETGKASDSPPVRSGIPSPGALLEEAKLERKRVLLMEHIGAIKVLRDEKKFTFRAIADWLTKRGIEVDHSAVYRAYEASIPEEQRAPFQDWSDVDEPSYSDIQVNKKQNDA
jgi:hypothetical protein